MKTLTALEFQVLKKNNPELAIVDVRLATDFEREHIANSTNNCVFEIDFGKNMTNVAPQKSNPICVYGAAEDSYESRVAAEKLERAGYTAVYEFRGGFEDWKRSGFAMSERGEINKSSDDSIAGELPVDIEESEIEWTGRNLANRHWGLLKLCSGVVRLQNGHLTGGTLVIDMNSLSNKNLKNAKIRKVLEDHLRSDDFFDVESYPEARIVLAKIDQIVNAKVGAPNLDITGTLTIKGVTEEIAFVATEGVNEEGKWIAQAHFDFDRTRWNTIYGSGKFFKNLGMHVVNDHVSLQLKIVLLEESLN